MQIDRDALQALIDAAAETSAPHVDVGRILGLGVPLKIAVEDVGQTLLENAILAFSLEYADDRRVHVRSEDGGLLVTWEGEF